MDFQWWTLLSVLWRWTVGLLAIESKWCLSRPNDWGDGNPAFSPLVAQYQPSLTSQDKTQDQNPQHLMMLRKLIILQGWLAGLRLKCPEDDFDEGSSFRLLPLFLFSLSPHFPSRGMQWQKRACPPEHSRPSPQSGPKPLDDFFFWSLWPRGKSQNGHFWPATKGNEIEIPQPPFITAAQTLQGLKLSGQLYNSAAVGRGWGQAAFRVLLQHWPLALWGGGGRGTFDLKLHPLPVGFTSTHTNELVGLHYGLLTEGGKTDWPLQSCRITSFQNSANALLWGGRSRVICARRTNGVVGRSDEKGTERKLNYYLLGIKCGRLSCGR